MNDIKTTQDDLMASDIAIKVSDLVISYRDIKKISVKRLVSGKKQPNNLFTAVNEVSFDVKKGEILGICGKNGSGKSTLLNAIAGIFSPDSGKIELFNSSISLLSIGVGFQKKLSGRNNIYLSGLLLGFSEKQIEEKFDEIVEFSELGEKINEPVSSYSKGMYSKLAFAITAILETDIMLIDEVFSVGDARFKKKSYAKMKKLITTDHRTVVIVSHSLKTLESLCDRVLWINDGKVKQIGDAKEVIAKYRKFMNSEI